MAFFLYFGVYFTQMCQDNIKLHVTCNTCNIMWHIYEWFSGKCRTGLDLLHLDLTGCWKEGGSETYYWLIFLFHLSEVLYSYILMKDYEHVNNTYWRWMYSKTRDILLKKIMGPTILISSPCMIKFQNLKPIWRWKLVQYREIVILK